MFWNIPIIPHIFEMFQYFFPPDAEKPQKKEGFTPPFLEIAYYQPVPSSVPYQRPSSLSWMVQQR